MREGWYLMNIGELEELLRAWRAGDRETEVGTALTIDEAIAIRDAGNVPDDDERSLRIVLFAGDEALEQKRLRYEPDFHRAPVWRREGSRPVHVVPLRDSGAREVDAPAWWEQPRIKELEAKWRSSGTVAGIEVPGEYRSFVFKTVIALQDAGESVTPDSIGASIARWLAPEDARRIQESLKARGPGI